MKMYKNSPDNSAIFPNAGIEFNKASTIICKLFKNDTVRNALNERIALNALNKRSNLKILVLNPTAELIMTGKIHVIIEEMTITKSKLFHPDLKYDFNPLNSKPWKHITTHTS